LSCYAVHMRNAANAAQRWFKFQNIGRSPHRMAYHAMGTDGTRAFVLAGVGASANEISLINVFRTSMYFRPVVSSGHPPRLRTQRTSSTRNLSVTLLILVRKPPNLRRSHPRVPRPRSNYSTRHSLHRRPTVLPVCKTLPPLYRAVLVSRGVSRKTMSAKVQPSTMGSSPHLILFLKEKLQG
jgi:hypothetical protein